MNSPISVPARLASLRANALQAIGIDAWLLLREHLLLRVSLELAQHKLEAQIWRVEARIGSAPEAKTMQTLQSRRRIGHEVGGLCHWSSTVAQADSSPHRLGLVIVEVGPRSVPTAARTGKGPPANLLSVRTGALHSDHQRSDCLRTNCAA